jgi:hypothetical protein
LDGKVENRQMSETSDKVSSSPKDGAAKSEKSTTASSETSGSSSDGAAAAAKPSGGDKATASSAKSEVYYGKFSNVKNPAYRGGWDDIWGGKKSRAKPAADRKTARKNPEPITLNLDITELPEDLRAGLSDFARAELKRQKSRLSYDRREKTGAVSWRIECRIDR